jgi:hypothetical protein
METAQARYDICCGYASLIEGIIMKTTLTILTVLALAVPLPTLGQGKGEAKAKEPSGGSTQMHRDMMKGSEESMSMKSTGDIDHDFVRMMRHHHQMGVQMAEQEIKNGKDPKAREMAQKIADSQKQEIKEFDEWLKSKGDKGGGHSEHNKGSSK